MLSDNSPPNPGRGKGCSYSLVSDLTNRWRMQALLSDHFNKSLILSAHLPDTQVKVTGSKSIFSLSLSPFHSCLSLSALLRLLTKIFITLVFRPWLFLLSTALSWYIFKLCHSSFSIAVSLSSWFASSLTAKVCSSLSDHVCWYECYD